ncbi:acriflavin resistance protein [Bacillus sp. VT-16-64]|nr:acriflavin resistance protein [Bacillus sp. VT-16-64]
MRLLQMLVQRKILIILATFFTIVLGIFTFFNLDKELTPTVGLDSATIHVEASNLHIDDVERKITNPLEQTLQEMEGIKEISSTTSIGRSSIKILFESGKGDEIFKDVESKANVVLSDIPNLDYYQVLQDGKNTSFEFIVDVSGGNPDQMSAFAKDILKPRLEKLSEVREVKLDGFTEQQVDIHFDQDKMNENHITIQQAVEVIQQLNNEAIVGELTDGHESLSLRWDTALKNMEDLKTLQIPTENGLVELKDISAISINPVTNSSNTWKNGSKDMIMVQIARKAGASQADMAEAVRNELRKIEEEGLVKGFTVNEVIAHADFVNDSMNDVTTNMWIGGMIAIVVLYLFLRNIRAAFIIGLSIPTSILLTFIAIGLLDYSMNMLTLIGLGLGIGMMVDSSIVILEAIYKKKEQGLNNLQAVLEGTKEVASAIIASVLTTIVVFLPIGLIGGDSGKFMMILSVVTAITLISSVIIAFTLIPTLANEFIRLKKQKSNHQKTFFMSIYKNTVAWCIQKKSRSFIVIVAFFIVFSLSLFLIPKIPMKIMPDMFNRYTEMVIDLENGVSQQEKEMIAEKVHETVSSTEDVKANYVLDLDDRLIVNIVMTTGSKITTEQEKVTENILKKLRVLEETQPIRGVERALDGISGYPVQIHMSGDEYAELRKGANALQKELKSIKGITDVTSSLDNFSETPTIQLKEENIKAAGLSTLHIKQTIEAFLLQEPIGIVEWDGDELQVYAHQGNEKLTKEALLELSVPTANGEKKLSSFVAFEKEYRPDQIFHKNGERYISIMADADKEDLGTINNDIQKVLKGFDSSQDFTVTLAGDLEEQNQLMNEFLFAFGIALFLVYVVMAVQFNHLGQPLIVMSIIPITIVGAILGLFITQAELHFMSGMGFIILIGIVLNNAILIIDRTNQLRKKGLPVIESLLQAGENRIRPIFMTTLTTVGGMLPLALATGMSADYQAPLSIVIISGMLFSTFITLLLIPCVYRLFSKS